MAIICTLLASWKDELLGAYTLEFEYDGWIKFRLYARLKQDKTFEITHGKPWDAYTNRKMEIRDYAGLNHAYKDAYRVAHARLNPKQGTLPLEAVARTAAPQQEQLPADAQLKLLQSIKDMKGKIKQYELALGIV